MQFSSLYSSNGNGNGHHHSQHPPKPAGESSSLRGEATETPIPTADAPHDANQGEAPNKERDQTGRFAKGNKGGPGNPYNRRVAELKRIMQSCATDEDAIAIAKKLIEEAKAGNLAAQRIFHQYYTPNTVEPDKQNIEEAEVLQKEAGIMSQMPGLLTKPDPSLPLMMIREARAASTEKVGHMMVNLLNCPQERIPEMQSVLQHDPRTAKDWLDNGVPARKQESRRERKRKAQRRKRPS